MVNPKPRVNLRLKLSPTVPRDTSPTYIAQLALLTGKNSHTMYAGKSYKTPSK